jgi:hypothetical protein
MNQLERELRRLKEQAAKTGALFGCVNFWSK